MQACTKAHTRLCVFLDSTFIILIILLKMPLCVSYNSMVQYYFIIIILNMTMEQKQLNQEKMDKMDIVFIPLDLVSLSTQAHTPVCSWLLFSLPCSP